MKFHSIACVLLLTLFSSSSSSSSPASQQKEYSGSMELTESEAVNLANTIKQDPLFGKVFARLFILTQKMNDLVLVRDMRKNESTWDEGQEKEYYKQMRHIDDAAKALKAFYRQKAQGDEDDNEDGTIGKKEEEDTSVGEEKDYTDGDNDSKEDSTFTENSGKEKKTGKKTREESKDPAYDKRLLDEIDREIAKYDKEKRTIWRH